MEKTKARKEDAVKTNKEDGGKQKKHVSRDDLRNTLHAHFQTSKTSTKSSSYESKDKYIRKHVVSFLQVKKVKLRNPNKRTFNSFDSGRCKLLCITTHEVSDAQTQVVQEVAQLHFVNFLANFTIECKKTWNLDAIESIENCLDDLANYPKGSFRLHFESRDHDPLQLLVDDDEEKHGMMEFVWILLALSVESFLVLPKSTFSIEELSDMANQLGWGPKYSLEVNLIEFQKNKAMLSIVAPTKFARMRSSSDDPTAHPVVPLTSWKSVEYEDALNLFSTIKWSECTVDSVQLHFQQRLNELEDENIEFLLALQNKDKKAIDVIISSVDEVLQQVRRAEKWTEEADGTLSMTASNMSQFESLNNHMEVHFKNNVALQETLDSMMTAIDIPRESMAILLKPVSIFPQDHSIREEDDSQESSLSKILDAMQRLSTAVKSVESFPAKEMAAFQARREELATLGTAFGGKVASGFDSFMLNLVKSPNGSSHIENLSQGRRRSLSGGHESISPRKGVRDREVSDVKDDRSRRSTVTVIEDINWSFRCDRLHSQLLPYQDICQTLHLLSPKAAAQLRDIYVKHVSPLYLTHFQQFYRNLKEKIPKSKPQGKHGQWSLHMSFSHTTAEASTIGTNASVLLKQALDHTVALCQSEQEFVKTLFIESNKKQKPEPVELTMTMEKLFDKLPKRLADFGDSGVNINIFEAISMIVIIQQQIRSLDPPSEFLSNTFLNFQLHLKRSLSKYMEEQELWLTHTHPDTRLVGVLGPVQKVMNLVEKLDEASTGISSDESMEEENPLLSIYDRLLAGLFEWLEKAAATKPKYSHLVRMENYKFIHDKVQTLSEHSCVLKKYEELTFESYSSYLTAYVTWLWDCEVGKLTTIFATIETLLTTVPSDEIQFHVSKQDVRKAAESVDHTLEKSMKHINDRLKKHLSHSTDMINVVVERLRDIVLTTYRRYTTLSKQCFDLELEPSLERFSQLLDKLKF